MNKQMKKDFVKELVTEKLIAELETGTVPWHKPWAGGLPRSLSTGKPYKGINLFILGSYSFKSSYWGTFKQISKLGGKVKEGEKSAIVEFWKFGETEKINVFTGEKEKQKYAYQRYYRVFNVDQTEGLPEKYLEELKNKQNEEILSAEEIYENYPETKPTLKFNLGQRASYSPHFDEISMPPIERFDNSDYYYSTLFHEIAHSSGHSSRLDRNIENSFGDHQYSEEELVAEITAAIISAYTNLKTEVLIKNQAAYIKHWLEVFKNDRKVLLHTMSQAKKAVDYILNLNYNEKETEEETKEEVVLS